MRVFLIPVRIGRGKSGDAKSGCRNVQVTTDGGSDNLHALAAAVVATGKTDKSIVEIKRQILDLFPDDTDVYDGAVDRHGTALGRVIMYRDGMSDLPRLAAERLAQQPF